MGGRICAALQGKRMERGTLTRPSALLPMDSGSGWAADVQRGQGAPDFRIKGAEPITVQACTTTLVFRFCGRSQWSAPCSAYW